MIPNNNSLGRLRVDLRFCELALLFFCLFKEATCYKMIHEFDVERLKGRLFLERPFDLFTGKYCNKVLLCLRSSEARPHAVFLAGDKGAAWVFFNLYLRRKIMAIGDGVCFCKDSHRVYWTNGTRVVSDVEVFYLLGNRIH